MGWAFSGHFAVQARQKHRRRQEDSKQTSLSVVPRLPPISTCTSFTHLSHGPGARAGGVCLAATRRSVDYRFAPSPLGGWRDISQFCPQAQILATFTTHRTCAMPGAPDKVAAGCGRPLCRRRVARRRLPVKVLYPAQVSKTQTAIRQAAELPLLRALLFSRSTNRRTRPGESKVGQ